MKSLWVWSMIVSTTLLLFANARADEINAADVDEFTVLDRGGFDITIDAKFGDWSLDKNVLFMGKDTWEPFQGGTWDGPDDCTARLRVLYDEDNLYFALQVADDEYVVAKPGMPWENDGVQIAIDGTNEKFPPPPGLNGTTTQLYNFSIVDGWQKEAGSFQGDAEIVMMRDKAAKQNLFEWRMPTEIFAKKGTKLKAGKKIAFAIIINDSDKNAKGQKGWVGWGNHTIVFGKNTEDMKALVLSKESMDVDALGKLTTTWGKLKQVMF